MYNLPSKLLDDSSVLDTLIRNQIEQILRVTFMSAESAYEDVAYEGNGLATSGGRIGGEASGANNDIPEVRRVTTKL
ncbi:hypothetical protein BGZ51_008454 [Haplosporangium sp. Z 767]|nr:hypothetical protein BGZ51_008454 [Haplosporangium sp. Z 767]KAF9180236.1 hypothetical protein BGZ50_006367 [Haplosporangium sp. Z 11]